MSQMVTISQSNETVLMEQHANDRNPGGSQEGRSQHEGETLLGFVQRVATSAIMRWRWQKVVKCITS